MARVCLDRLTRNDFHLRIYEYSKDRYRVTLSEAGRMLEDVESAYRLRAMQLFVRFAKEYDLSTFDKEYC